MRNCRLSTIFLSKVTKLSQTAVVYRIKRLERKGYISKYDAFVNWPMLPFPAEFFFVTVPPAKCAEFERKMEADSGASSLFHLLHKRNYLALAFFWPEERTGFIKYLSAQGFEYETFSVLREELIPFSIYDVPVKLPHPKIIPLRKITLDSVDTKIATLLSNGCGRDSILELSRKSRLSYDVVLYHFRKLMKQNFFLLFFAQPSRSIFGLQVDILVVKTKSTSFNRAKEIFGSTKKNPYVVEAGPNIYFTQIFSKSFAEYKQALEKIQEGFGDDVIDWTVYNTKDWVFINRTPFEKLIGK